MLKAVLFALIVTGLGAGPAFAQARLPTDGELRAVYCIGIVQRELQLVGPLFDLVRGSPPSEAKDKALQQQSDTEQNLARMRAYILPKITYLDPVALTLAKRRADTDMDFVAAEGANLATRCPEKSGSGLTECARKGSQSELASRIRGCNDTSWLPF
jgi:hypothetical protein